MQNNKTVLIISGIGENDAITSISKEIEHIFHHNNISTYFISATDESLSEKLIDAITNFEILFAFAYLGIGSDFCFKLKDSDDIVNIWEYFNIPFFKFQGDCPSYFIKRHGNTPINSINIYPSKEFSQVQSWYFQKEPVPHIISPALIFDRKNINTINFTQRKNGTLFFLKNGNNPNQLLDLWETKLPSTISNDLFQIAEELVADVLACKTINIFQHIETFVHQKTGNSFACRDIVKLYSAQIDDFLRRVKATMIGESLSKFPVRIIGKNWEHVRNENSVANFSNELNFSQHSETIFNESLGLIDMTPNMDFSVHDRFCRAVGNYGFIFTNKSSYMGEIFPEFDNDTYIFDKEIFETRIEFYLSNKEYVIEQGIALGELGRQRISNKNFVDQLIELAERIKFLYSKDKPSLQNFYIWNN